MLGFLEVARGEGNYQSTRDGKTLVWNSDPKPGDVATWSGDRDRADYAHGFGRLTWYTREPESSEPRLYARYWGRMVDGKFEGPVNVHAKRKTHHAIFINGIRVTRWTPGTASSRSNAQWRMLVARESRTRQPATAEPSNTKSGREEPEAPAAGPEEENADGETQKTKVAESIQDLWNERRPKIDIDDSLRLLAFPPRKLR